MSIIIENHFWWKAFVSPQSVPNVPSYNANSIGTQQPSTTHNDQTVGATVTDTHTTEGPRLNCLPHSMHAYRCCSVPSFVCIVTEVHHPVGALPGTVDADVEDDEDTSPPLLLMLTLPSACVVSPSFELTFFVADTIATAALT